MDQALIQAKVNQAYAKAAWALGSMVSLYRPDATQRLIPPLDSRYVIASVMAWFNPDAAMRGMRPAGAVAPVAYASVDRTQLEVGDYLMDTSQNVWFVGALQPLLATPCVRCNRALTLTRAVPVTGPAAYGGNAPGNMTTILTGWPCFLTPKSRALSPEERVPGDTRLNTVLINLPVTAGVEIVPNDLLLDDQADPMRYTVSIATATDWGWTIEAYYAGA